MLRESLAFSGFTAKDLAAQQDFYSTVLGLNVEDTGMGLQVHLGGDRMVFIYQKDDHQPAAHTILNFPVDDIDAAIDELSGKGVVFERYPNLPRQQDEKGVLRGKQLGYGPDIAWFKDPAGNILSILNG